MLLKTLLIYTSINKQCAGYDFESIISAYIILRFNLCFLSVFAVLKCRNVTQFNVFYRNVTQFTSRISEEVYKNILSI